MFATICTQYIQYFQNMNLISVICVIVEFIDLQQSDVNHVKVKVIFILSDDCIQILPHIVPNVDHLDK